MHILLTFILASTALAQNKQRPNFHSNHKIIISYGNLQWNQDATKIESGTIVLRDNHTGKLILIELQETEPNSSIFRTFHKIHFKGKRVAPSIYIPDQSKLSSNKEDVLKAIQDKQLKRKPFLYLRNRFGMQTIDIFDSKKKLKRALKAHRKNLALSDAQKFLLDEELLTKDEVRNMNNQALQERLKELEGAEKAREITRAKYSVKELERRKALQAEFDALSASEQSDRRMQSQKLRQEALQMIQNKQYSEAIKKAKQASDLAPYDKDAYFTFGITLFYTKRHNRAIVTFRILRRDAYRVDEAKYYEAMCHYRQAEFINAVKLFSEVKIGKDKALGGSAAFYLGLINFQKENYNQAKADFEFVLDYSDDADMDMQAENYIESIVRLQQFDRAMEKPYTLSITTGLSEDSNILLVSDGSTANATAEGDGGLRLLLNSSIERKHIHRPKEQLKYKATATYQYSMDDVFARADATVLDFNASYMRPTKMFNGKYTSTFIPGFNLTYMDLEDTGTRENILNSFYIKNTNQKVKDANHVKGFDVEYYFNDSKIDVSSDDDDSTSHRLDARWKNIVFLDRAKGKLLNWDLGLSTNQAEGKNFSYNRAQGNITFTRKLTSLDSMWSTKLRVFHAIYASDDDRKDTQFALTTNLIHQLNEDFTIIGNAGYTDNSSSVDARSYDKYTIGILLNGNFDF